ASRARVRDGDARGRRSRGSQWDAVALERANERRDAPDRMLEDRLLNHPGRDVNVVREVDIERDVENEVFGFQPATVDNDEDIEIRFRGRVAPRFRPEQLQGDQVVRQARAYPANEVVE